MINKATILGRLGKDPEVRYTQSGTAVCNLSVATSESWRDKQTGEKQERTEWHRVSMFGKLAEIAGEYLAKGSLVYLEGRIQTREYEKDGIKRYATEIVANEMKMLDGKPAESRREPAKPEPAPGGDDFDDDIPFRSLPMEAGG